MAATAYVQGYAAYSFDDFSGGVNLRDKSDTVGDKEAIDLLNVTFTDRGAIKQRDGYADLTGSDLTNRVDSLSPYYTAGGTKHLIAGCGTRLEALDIGGAIVASATGLTSGPYSFARFAAPGSEHLYATNGVDAPRRWDGSAWTTPTATVDGVAALALPKAGAFAVTAALPGATSGTNANNRLIATAFPAGATTSGPGGTASNPSRVYFSNPGDPLTWETDGGGSPVRGRNFRDLTPGDGEGIMGAISWQELTFIFKETKFFVVWGEGTAADGTPTFQVREVLSGVGLAAKQALCAGRDGVYFLGRRGIYVTTGGPPQLLSDKITPLWTGDPDVYYQGSPINLSQTALARMTWMDDQLHCAVPTGAATANDRMLVYDTQHQWWTIHDIPASALVPFRRADREELTFGYSATLTPKRVGRRDITIVQDRGVNMTSRWRSGWSDYGQPSQKTIRETKAWAFGALTVSFAVDFEKAMTQNVATVFNVPSTWPSPGGTWSDWITLDGGLWPSAGEVSDRMINRAVQGTVFSTQFANHPSTQSWALHRVARHLRETRGASVL